jgi:hypothetical protein
MTNQKLFEALERLCGFTVLQSDMFEIIRAVEADKMPMTETIEQAAENAFNDFKSKNPIVPQKHILPFKLGYIEGAKWQQERMYSEEDMIAFMQFIVSQESLGNTSSVSITTAKYYLEQFKNK